MSGTGLVFAISSVFLCDGFEACTGIAFLIVFDWADFLVVVSVLINCEQLRDGLVLTNFVCTGSFLSTFVGVARLFALYFFTLEIFSAAIFCLDLAGVALGSLEVFEVCFLGIVV